MSERHSAENPDPVSVDVSEIIHRARGGSLPHLRQLPAWIPRSYVDHSTDIMDVVFQYLKSPSPGDEEDEEDDHRIANSDSLAIASLFILIEVARWLSAQERRTPIAISTSLRLFSEFEQYAACVLHLLMTITTDHNILYLHHFVTLLFHTLLEASPRLLPTMADSHCMLDVAIVLSTATYRRSPVLYPMGKDPKSNAFVDEEGDQSLALFYKLTMQNPRGMAEALMDGRICDPASFVAQAVARMKSLKSVSGLPNLKGLRGPNVELGSVRHLVLSMGSLIKLEPQLRYLFLYRPAYPVAFMRTLATMTALLYKRIPPTGATQEDENVRYLLEVVALTERVVEWVASTSTNVIRNLGRIIQSGGVFHILGWCVPLVANQNRSKVDTIFDIITPYALYRHTMHISLVGMSQVLHPQLMKTPDTSYRKGSLGTAMTYLASFREFMEEKTQRCLYDSFKHNDHTRRRSAQPPLVERVCSKCRTVAYCSEQCQMEDWNAFHRYECLPMCQHFHDHNPSRSMYHYRYRKLHTTILCYGFEGKELENRCMSPHVPGNRERHSPLKVQTGIELLWRDPDADAIKSGMSVSDYVRRTSPLVPPHMRPRFDALISTFQHWAVRAGRRVPGLSEAAPFALGSLRLIERPFRFGEVDMMVVLLLEQVRPLREVVGSLIEKDRKVTEFLRRGPGVESSYEILGGLTYATPKRKYREWNEAIEKLKAKLRPQQDLVASRCNLYKGPIYSSEIGCDDPIS